MSLTLDTEHGSNVAVAHAMGAAAAGLTAPSTSIVLPFVHVEQVTGGQQVAVQTIDLSTRLSAAMVSAMSIELLELNASARSYSAPANGLVQIAIVPDLAAPTWQQMSSSLYQADVGTTAQLAAAIDLTLPPNHGFGREMCTRNTRLGAAVPRPACRVSGAISVIFRVSGRARFHFQPDLALSV